MSDWTPQNGMILKLKDGTQRIALLHPELIVDTVFWLITEIDRGVVQPAPWMITEAYMKVQYEPYEPEKEKQHVRTGRPEEEAGRAAKEK